MVDFFSIMPVEIFMDDRLSKTDIRVLGAIMSWRNKDTNLCHPSREQISERCGLPACKISTATTHLVDLGWLEKSGNGGRSMRCTYKFCVPTLVNETVPESVTVTNSVTVPESVTKTVPESVTKTVPESVRGKKLKETKNKLKETTLSKLSISEEQKNKPGRKKNTAMTLSEFLQDCKERNVLPILEDDKVFCYAADIKLPVDFLRLAWIEFKKIHTDLNRKEGKKRQASWSQTFRNYVEGNWLHLWFIDNEGNYSLTTAGKQLQRVAA